jgi:hypothetical protein
MERVEQQQTKDEEMKAPGGRAPGFDASKFADITTSTRKTSKMKAAA